MPNALAEYLVLRTGRAIQRPQPLRAAMPLSPDLHPPHPQTIPVVLRPFLRPPPATFVRFSAASFDVPEAGLPSTMFCFPDDSSRSSLTVRGWRG